MSLSEEELDMMCHNYVHNWISENLKKTNQQLKKYAIESKLDYMQRSNSVNPHRQSEASLDISGITNDHLQTQPRFMQPTVNRALKIQE